MNAVHATILVLAAAASAALIYFSGIAIANGVSTTTCVQTTVNSGWPGYFGVIIGLIGMVVISIIAWDEAR